MTANASVSAMFSGFAGTGPTTASPPDPLGSDDVDLSLQGEGAGNSAGTINSYAGVGFQANAIANLSGNLSGQLDTTASDFQGYINWGDSNQWSPATFAINTPNNGNYFIVKGSHVYAQAGTYHIVLYAAGKDGTSLTQLTSTATVTNLTLPSGVTALPPTTTTPTGLQDVQLVLAGYGPGLNPATLNSYQGVGFQANAVATLNGVVNGQTDTNLSDFQAYINWGDGNQWTQAALAKNTGGSGEEFVVEGSHVYNTSGTFTIVVYAVGPDGTSLTQPDSAGECCTATQQ